VNLWITLVYSATQEVTIAENQGFRGNTPVFNCLINGVACLNDTFSFHEIYQTESEHQSFLVSASLRSYARTIRRG
jgi:hypothetical protein